MINDNRKSFHGQLTWEMPSFTGFFTIGLLVCLHALTISRKDLGSGKFPPLFIALGECSMDYDL
jgi:hypothetical protein